MSRDIIDSIDGALDDWQVSADAMRWTPESTSTAASRAAQRGLTGTSWMTTMHVEHVDLELLREIFRPAIAQVNAAFQQVKQAFHPAMTRDRYTLWPPAQDEPEDVRARALRLRQTRNTGPTKTPPGHRPPRTMHANRPGQRYTPTHTGRTARPKPNRNR